MKYLILICLGALAFSCNTSGKVKTAPSSTAPGIEARETPRSYTFMGNEPFWSAQVKGGQITFRTPDEGPITYPYSAPQEKGGQKVIESKNATSGIKITFRDSPCSDSMSGESFPYTVEVTKDGKIYRGCGK